MRRIQQYCGFTTDDSTLITKRDYRLLLAVARAAEGSVRRTEVFTSGSEMRLDVHSFNDLCKALDKLNAKTRKRT